MTETIYALSTPAGRGGVAVMRVSGPRARDALSALGVGSLPRPRMATRATLRRTSARRNGDAEDRAVEDRDALIDDALLLFFPAPHSFTGEDVVEFHLHGGIAIIEAVHGVLAACPGFRLAGPGEFTRRAFLNGKMDLVEAEGLVDLIEAETEAQRVQALRQLKGALSELYLGWQKRLADQLALIELGLDFADEGDVDSEDSALDRDSMAGILAEMQAHLDDGRRGEITRSGVRVAIIGAPNVGKSSLLNALARRDAAIVSDIAGTTRDLVEVHLNLGGHSVILTDTAGLRDSDDVIEREGMRRSLAAAEEADLVLVMGDCRTPDGLPALGNIGGDPLILWNKADMATEPLPDGIVVSARTGRGMSELEAVLEEKVRGLALQSEAPVLTRARHREAVALAAARVSDSLSESDPVLLAEHLRSAVAALGRVVGKVDVEDLLDRIFRDFCIGK